LRAVVKEERGNDDADEDAPNVKLAFALIRRGIACRIEGRDIGFGLIKLVEKLGGPELNDLRKALLDYQIYECDKAMQKNQQSRVELINDKCETLNVLIDRAESQKQNIYWLKQTIKDMFSDANDPKTPKHILTLSSVHKSKGREWQRVFILGRSQFMPSKYATQEWMMQQEQNLIYVAITRAQHELTYITNIPE